LIGLYISNTVVLDDRLENVEIKISLLYQ